MTAPSPTRATRLAVVLLILALAGLVATPAAAGTAARAIVDPDLAEQTSAQRAASLAEIGGQLKAQYVRLDVHWDRAEPAPGWYDPAYLDDVEELVDLAVGKGLKVVICFAYPPEWASDATLWNAPPAGFARGYQPFYAPRADAADDFGAMVGTVATRFKDKVFAYECWNEPNLWLFMYPQQKKVGDDFAIERYALLLRACHDAVDGVDGVGGADPAALVIGGTTAPIGEADATVPSPYRTRPAYWAMRMKALGLAEFFDAYSHHPYIPGGTTDIRPEAPPSDPRTTVQLGNISTLLKIFPDRDFYLTEFGYNTSFSQMFGGRALTQAQQADYLRRAYKFASRYAQVKALFWYLRRDSSPSGSADDRDGVYTGLRTVTNARKRSWFAFAGGMRLTLAASSPVRAGASTRLSGALTCSRLATTTRTGGLDGKALEMQRRVNASWKTVKTVTTRAGGRYVTWVRLTSDARFRVIWRGVVIGPSRFVDVR